MMTETRKQELRELVKLYHERCRVGETILGARAANIAADVIGQKAILALPELLDEIERLELKLTVCKHEREDWFA